MALSSSDRERSRMIDRGVRTGSWNGKICVVDQRIKCPDLAQFKPTLDPLNPREVRFEEIKVNRCNQFYEIDDLQVILISLMRGFSFAEESHVKEAHILEERLIDFSIKAFNLLRKLPLSKNPLMRLCFTDSTAQASVELAEEVIMLIALLAIKEDIDVNKEESESNISALCDCINNLYSSVKSMEITSQKLLMPRSCLKYYYDKGHKFCNPKLEKILADIGGFFVADFRRFMLTDNLHISSISLISVIGN
ncbi:hypothetical protein IEQ34_022995 [Dendrobium chrysotoxum]|uniref:NR LBD domain-containing protein n=1 Tax=Dendrobium chrysotoxum TaxID=161865 RepID=A0AAV7G0L1_DENCH|nr:hypothetical protein IEQ34_022995 [Dendrobium chrysotoxum]